jgi:hypothetical protein
MRPTVSSESSGVPSSEAEIEPSSRLILTSMLASSP